MSTQVHVDLQAEHRARKLNLTEFQSVRRFVLLHSSGTPRCAQGRLRRAVRGAQI